MSNRNRLLMKVGTVAIVLLLSVIIFLIIRINRSNVASISDPSGVISVTENINSLSNLVTKNKLATESLDGLSTLEPSSVQDMVTREILNLDESQKSKLSNSFVANYLDYVTDFNKNWLILDIPIGKFEVDAAINTYIKTPSPESHGVKIIYSVDNQKYVELENDVLDIKLSDRVLYLANTESFIEYNSFVFPNEVSRKTISYVSKPNSLKIDESFKKIAYTTNQILNPDNKSIYSVGSVDNFSQSKVIISLENLHEQTKKEQDIVFEEKNLPKPDISDTDAPENISKIPDVKILKLYQNDIVITVDYQKFNLYKIKIDTSEIIKLFTGNIFTDIFTACDQYGCLVIDCDSAQGVQIDSNLEIITIRINACTQIKSNFVNIVSDKENYIKYNKNTNIYNYWDNNSKKLTEVILN